MVNKTLDKKKDWKAPVSSFFKAHVLLSWSVYSVCVIIILGIAEYLACRYWECLLGDTEHTRNFILVVAAFIGLPLTLWRSIVADRQSKTAQQQSETAQRGLLNERYQKGAEMLGGEKLSVRLGGIYALENLAREHAEDYHIQIVKLFCAFVRDENTRNKKDNDAKSDEQQEERPKIREDVQAIMTALGRRNNEQQEIEKQETSKGEILLNLVGAKLPGAMLHSANLSGALLKRADLSGTFFAGGVRGLNQGQLNRAVADPDNPPVLMGAKDSQTGKPLEWDPNFSHRLPKKT